MRPFENQKNLWFTVSPVHIYGYHLRIKIDRNNPPKVNLLKHLPGNLFTDMTSQRGEHISSG